MGGGREGNSRSAEWRGENGQEEDAGWVEGVSEVTKDTQVGGVHVCI